MKKSIGSSIAVVLFALLFISGCKYTNANVEQAEISTQAVSDESSDNISYDIEAVTGTIVDARMDEQTMTTIAGTVPVITTYYDKYVTIESEDGTKTEFQSSSLYDLYDSNSEGQVVDYYKLTEYTNGEVSQISYQLTDEVPYTFTSDEAADVVTYSLLTVAFILFILWCIDFILTKLA